VRCIGRHRKVVAPKRGAMDGEIVKLGVGEERQEESEGTAAEHSGHFIAAEEFWRATSPTKWLYALTDPNTRV
jgi:hypothetical protein